MSNRINGDVEKSKRKDLVFFIFLLVVGLSGLIWSLNTSNDKSADNQGKFMKYTDPKEEKRVVEERILLEKLESEKKTSSLDYKENNFSKATLEMGEANEKGETLEFTVTNYNPNHKYEIDFGNGDTKIFTSDKISYKYEEVGEYNIKVKALVGQLSQTIFHKRINILEPLEVADDVLEIDY